MSEWETLRAAAEIMEREGYPGAGNARRLGVVLQCQAVRDDPNYALAEELYEAWAAGRSGLPTWSGFGVAEASWWIRAARAARIHIAAERAENSAEPEPLTVEPPVGSVVRDRHDDEWERKGSEWRLWDYPIFHSFEELDDMYGPLTLVSAPEGSS